MSPRLIPSGVLTRSANKDYGRGEERSGTRRTGLRSRSSDVPWHNPREGRWAVANSRWELSAALVVLAASAEAQRDPPRTGIRERRSRPSADGELADERRRLVQPPLFAADADQPRQRRELKGVWRTRLNGSGVGTKYSGEAQPMVHDGVIYVVTGADDVFAIGVETRRDPLDVHGESRRHDRHRLLRVDEPRRRPRRRQSVRRPAGRQARCARPANRRSARGPCRRSAGRKGSPSRARRSTTTGSSSPASPAPSTASAAA